MRALAAAPAAHPCGRWQGKVSPCRTWPGAAPWTQGSVPECATSHSQTHGTRTRRPDRHNQNMAPVHSLARRSRAHGAGTHGARHVVPVHTGWHTTPVHTARPGTARAATAAPWHNWGRQTPGSQRSPLCHQTHQVVPAPTGAALSPCQSGNRGDLHMPSHGAKPHGVSPRSPQGEGPAGLSAPVVGHRARLSLRQPPRGHGTARHGTVMHTQEYTQTWSPPRWSWRSQVLPPLSRGTREHATAQTPMRDSDGLAQLHNPRVTPPGCWRPGQRGHGIPTSNLGCPQECPRAER